MVCRHACEWECGRIEAEKVCKSATVAAAAELPNWLKEGIHTVTQLGKGLVGAPLTAVYPTIKKQIFGKQATTALACRALLLCVIFALYLRRPAAEAAALLTALKLWAVAEFATFLFLFSHFPIHQLICELSSLRGHTISHEFFLQQCFVQ